jgi:hypothetical protein
MQAAIDDWPKFYRQMYQFLKPGGWFQHIEPNIELHCDNPDVPFDDDQYVKTIFCSKPSGLSRTVLQTAPMSWHLSSSQVALTDGFQHLQAMGRGVL